MSICELIQIDVWKKILSAFTPTQLYSIMFICKKFKEITKATLIDPFYKKKHNIPHIMSIGNILQSAKAMNNMMEGNNPTLIHHTMKFTMKFKSYPISTDPTSTNFIVCTGYDVLFCSIVKNCIVEKSLCENRNRIQKIKIIYSHDTCDFICSGLWMMRSTRSDIPLHRIPEYFICGDGNRIDIIYDDKTRFVHTALESDKWIIVITTDDYKPRCHSIVTDDENNEIHVYWIWKKDIFESKTGKITLKDYKNVQFKFNDIFGALQRDIIATRDGFVYCLYNRSNTVNCYIPHKDCITRKEYKFDNFVKSKLDIIRIIYAFDEIYIFSYRENGLVIGVFPLNDMKKEYELTLSSAATEEFPGADYDSDSLLFSHFEYNDHFFIRSEHNRKIFYWSHSSWENKESPLEINDSGDHNSELLKLPFGIFFHLKNNTKDLPIGRIKSLENGGISAFSLFDPIHKEKKLLLKEEKVSDTKVYPTALGFIYKDYNNDIVFADYSRPCEISKFKKVDNLLTFGNPWKMAFLIVILIIVFVVFFSIFIVKITPLFAPTFFHSM